jgi:hypothetical protein
MKSKLFIAGATLLFVSLMSCGNKKETAASVAQQWCELNGKVYKAEGTAKESAEQARDKFEKEIEAKYKNNKAFMQELEKEVEKCEAASEGR